ncbi:hypothetical protein FOL47_002512 [Perkinsus chesapeaki]|uniref:Uncharacterized protein n=1 Tax=Perkinsus chesapeaki TaxID=330153 RepID=A0A7J6N088_PERCH|nr:hypothetical protein FOL47_002512 [Perkinsus chesapeaki]
MSRVYSIDFDLPDHETLTGCIKLLEETIKDLRAYPRPKVPIPLKDSPKEQDESKEDYSSPVALPTFDMEEFWTPLRWQSAEPAVKMLDATRQAATSVDLIGLFEASPKRQLEDKKETSLATQDTIEMWFPRPPLCQYQMPIEAPLSLPSSLRRSPPLPRLDEPLLPLFCSVGSHHAATIASPEVGVELQVLSPLSHRTSGFNFTSVHKLISASESMRWAINPVYSIMLSLRDLLTCMEAFDLAEDEACLRPTTYKSPTIFKRRIEEAVENGDDDEDDDIPNSNVTKRQKTTEASSAVSNVSWTADDWEPRITEAELRRYQEVWLQEVGDQPRYFDYEDTMTGIPYISLADEIQDLRRPLQLPDSSSSSSVEDVPSGVPCVELVPYNAPPVPIGGWPTSDYLLSAEEPPAAISDAAPPFEVWESGLTSECSSTVEGSSEARILTLDDEIVSELSLESDESIFLDASTDPDDPDTSLECLTEVSEYGSSSASCSSMAREPLRQTPVLNRIQIEKSAGNQGNFEAQRRRKELLEAMTAWLSEMEATRERKAMADWDERLDAAQTCTTIQLYQGCSRPSQVWTPEVRHRDIEEQHQGSPTMRDVGSNCLTKIITERPVMSKDAVITLPRPYCTDLQIYEPRKLAIPMPLREPDDELDFEDSDWGTDESEFDDDWSIIADDAFYTEVDSFVLLG